MLPVIQKLLILQDRDRKILRASTELANIESEREAIGRKAKDAQTLLDAAKLKAKQLESDRKRIELDVEAKKSQIAKYALQQFQTKKNEEYRALAHEIENCKAAISKFEDQQLEVMEQIDAAQKESVQAAASASQILKYIEEQKGLLGSKQTRLSKELDDLEKDYDQLQAGVEEDTRERYERLRKQKGSNALVGIAHSSCGGCHMQLPVQIVLQCKGDQEIVTCPNCGRILYFTREMDLALAD